MTVVWSELRAERVARELAGLTARDLVAAELLCAVDGLVDQVVPADASCWSTFDPATTMLTSAVGRNLDEDGEDAVRFMELEYVLQAPGHYRGLMSSGDTLFVQHAVGGRGRGGGEGAHPPHRGRPGVRDGGCG